MKILSFLLAFLMIISLSGCDMLYSMMENIVEGKDEETENSELEPEIPEEPVDPNWPATAFGTEIPAAPERIAVASPALAEYIFDMGLMGKVCAVPEYCGFPGAENIPCIGSVSLPDLEAIKNSATEYILTFAQYEESVLVKIQQMNINVIVMEAPQSLDELRALYREIAVFVKGNVDGLSFGENYVSTYNALLDSVAYKGEKKKAGFLRAMDYMFITGDTLENELFAAVGLGNAAEGYTGYGIPEESWKEFDPEVLFINSHIHLIDLEGSDLYKKKTAVKGDKVYNADFDTVRLCTVRSMEILRDMLATVYPDYTGGTPLEPAYPSMYKTS